jgi:hypothetical protein
MDRWAEPDSTVVDADRKITDKPMNSLGNYLRQTLRPETVKYERHFVPHRGTAGWECFG